MGDSKEDAMRFPALLTIILLAPAWEATTRNDGADDRQAPAPIALWGRVIGPEGQPVVGALLKFEYMHHEGAGGTGGFVEFAGGKVVRTRADGTFKTPRELDPTDEYRVEVVAESLRPFKTDWIQVPVTTFPDIALRRPRRLRTVSGRVVDRRGEPVADAFMFQSGDGPHPTSAESDADGRFRIEGIYEGPASCSRRSWAIVFKDERSNPMNQKLS
jgi:hypothetical protein